MRSVDQADVRWFDQHLAPDFMNTNPDGKLIDRAAFLAQIGRGSPVKDIREHNVKIRLLGDFAIIHARTSYTRPDGFDGGRLVHRRLAVAAGRLALRLRPRQPFLTRHRVHAYRRCRWRRRRMAVVFACFLRAVFAWGFGFYAHGIYLVELQKARGWSTGLISSIVTGHYVLGALLLPRIAGRSAASGRARCSSAGWRDGVRCCCCPRSRRRGSSPCSTP